VHKLPADLRKRLISKPRALMAWEDITPIARNEWICWVESVKKEETRRDHVERTAVELVEGKRRPCCWIGCIHRTDKPLSPSVRGVLSKRSKTRNESRSKTSDLHNEFRKRLSALHR
jgi:Bacteriocin-protection, YdeI or OmpD-Associated